MAALLLGVPSSGSYTNQIAYALQQIYYAFYVQDDWRVSNKLTEPGIALGLRVASDRALQPPECRLLYDLYESFAEFGDRLDA